MSIWRVLLLAYIYTVILLGIKIFKFCILYIIAVYYYCMNKENGMWKEWIYKSWNSAFIDDVNLQKYKQTVIYFQLGKTRTTTIRFDRSWMVDFSSFKYAGFASQNTILGVKYSLTKATP